jgi:hypothetical protein
MSEWTTVETSSHQDHVIAHVIGASVVGYFSWDETAYLLLDIGFIWNIYLDGEMGLVPQSLAITELAASDIVRQELRQDIDAISIGIESHRLHRMSAPPATSPIQQVDFSGRGNSRRLTLSCEDNTFVVETSLETGEVKIYEL